MKMTLRPLAALGAALLLLAACKKSDTPVFNTTQDKTPVHQLAAALRSAPQTFTVTPGTYQQITGSKGTRLRFYPNSFRDASGHIIAGGTIEIQLTEMYRPGDMIRNRATTTDDGRLLISGGQVKIRATRNGQEVYARKYGIDFSQPAPSAQPMALYYGNVVGGDSTTNWDIADTSGNNGTTTGGTVQDSVVTGGSGVYYQFDSCTNFGLINCDYFYNSSSPLTDMTAIMPDTSFNGNNTLVFLVFPTINSATYMHQYVYTTHAFGLGSGYQVPVGMGFHIVSISNKNGTYYYDQVLSQTVTSNMSLTMNPQQQTLAQIQAALAAL